MAVLGSNVYLVYIPSRRAVTKTSFIRIRERVTQGSPQEGDDFVDVKEEPIRPTRPTFPTASQIVKQQPTTSTSLESESRPIVLDIKPLQLVEPIPIKLTVRLLENQLSNEIKINNFVQHLCYKAKKAKSSLPSKPQTYK